MTKTALANKEMKEKRGIERMKVLHDTEQQSLNRAQKERESVRSAKAQMISAGINAAGRLGSAGISKLSRNDPAFYKSYIKNLQDFVNVPHYDRLGDGKLLPYLYNYYEDSNGDYKKRDVPGILILHYLPTIGSQTSGNIEMNAINLSLARTKEKVLALSSRSTVNWESSDLGYNLFCSADIMTAILDLGRVIKVYQTYHSKNSYLARALITALGWSYADIEANFAEYRKQYDLLARQFNSAIVVPKSIGLMLRRAFLATNIFIDSDNSSYPRQMYAYVQTNFFRLEEDGGTAPLMSTNIRTSLSTFVNAVTTMIRRIADNPDFSEMYQDLRHAFGSDLVTLEETVTGEAIVFNTDALNREQIHNAEIAPTVYGSTPSFNALNWGLHQNPAGYIYQGDSSYVAGGRNRKISYGTSDPNVRQEIINFTKQHIFNMHKEEVTGDDIIDITRLRYVYELVEQTSSSDLIVYGCGTEFVHSAYVWSLTDDGNDIDFDSEAVSTYMVELNVNRDAVGRISRITQLSCFDWAPIVFYGILGTITFTLMDAYTTFIVDESTLKRIHEACVMGELYYPDDVFKSTFR